MAVARILVRLAVLALASTTTTDDTLDYDREGDRTGAAPMNRRTCYSYCKNYYTSAQLVKCKDGCDTVLPTNLQYPGKDCASAGQRTAYPTEFYRGCYYAAMKVRKRLRGRGARSGD